MRTKTNKWLLKTGKNENKMKEERQKDFMVNPSNCHSTKKETNSYAFNFMILTIDFTDSLLLSLNLWIRFHMNRHNCYTVNTNRIYILLIYQYLYAYIHVVSELAHKQSYYFIFSSFFGCGGVEVVLLMIFKSNHYHWHCRRHHPLFTGSYGRKKSSNNNKQKTKSYKISNKNFHKISIKCQYKETHTSV